MTDQRSSQWVFHQKQPSRYRALSLVIKAAGHLVFPAVLFMLTAWMLTGSAFYANPWLTILPFIVYYLVFLLFFTLTRRAWIGLAIVQLAYLAILTISHVMVDQRGTPFVQSDLFAIGDGMAFAGKVTLLFPRLLLPAVIISILLSAFAAWLKPVKMARPVRIAVPIMSILIVAVLMMAVFWRPPVLKNTFGITNMSWDQTDNYRSNGVLLGFLMSSYPVQVQMPVDYDGSHVKQVIGGADIQGSPAPAEQPENVIIVMSEAYVDLSIWDPSVKSLGSTTFFDQLKSESAAFTLVTPTFGGATCNTEYEVLTGQSIAFFGPAALPYNMYIDQDIPSLATLFESSGYESTIIHPNVSGFWNRDVVYDHMGFDQYSSIDDFKDADTIRGMVTDQVVFDRVLDRVESADSPQFIYLITIQNHMPYTLESFAGDHVPDLYDGPDSEKVNGFLKLMAETDRALEDFIGRLEQLNESTAVLYFGDHLPAVGNDFFKSFRNDQNPLQRYETSGLLWTNYGLDIPDRDKISSNLLGSWMCRSLGLQMDDYWRFNASLGESFDVISVGGIMSSDGFFSRIPDAPDELADRLDQYEMIQYDILFGSQYTLNR